MQPPGEIAAQTEAFGFSWDSTSIEWPNLQPPDLRRAIWRARKLFADIIHDITKLEGNPFTVPEIQTLLEGITVGGHRISDAQQVLNQRDSLNLLFSMVEDRSFELSARTACSLQAVAARGEALEEGVFRSGKVSISGTEYRPPEPSGLAAAFDRATKFASLIERPLERGIAMFLFSARTRLFWGGNKRTGRLLMNGILLEHGQDIVTIPAKRAVEFNRGMIDFYESADATEMMRFLSPLQLSIRFE